MREVKWSSLNPTSQDPQTALNQHPVMKISMMLRHECLTSHHPQWAKIIWAGWCLLSSFCSLWGGTSQTLKPAITAMLIAHFLIGVWNWNECACKTSSQISYHIFPHCLANIFTVTASGFKISQCHPIIVLHTSSFPILSQAATVF